MRRFSLCCSSLLVCVPCAFVANYRSRSVTQAIHTCYVRCVSTQTLLSMPLSLCYWPLCLSYRGALPPCTRTMHLPACGQDFACTRRKQGTGKLQIPSIWHGHDFHSPYGFSCLPACFLCGASYQLTHRIRRLFQALTLFVRHLNTGGSDGKPGAPKSKTWATGHLTWGSEYRFLEVHLTCII